MNQECTLVYTDLGVLPADPHLGQVEQAGVGHQVEEVGCRQADGDPPQAPQAAHVPCGLPALGAERPHDA